MPGGVGAGGENPPATRLYGFFLLFYEVIMKTKYTPTDSPYSLTLAYGKMEIVIKYDKCILENPESYDASLERINNRIDWCIRKSFENNQSSPSIETL